MADLQPHLITWAESFLGAAIVSVRGMVKGGSPWLLEGNGRSGVMRVGKVDEVSWMRLETVALELAAANGIVVPRVIAVDLDGDPPLLLVTAMPGSSTIPTTTPTTRLRALGAVTAALHDITVPPDLALPRRKHPIGAVDFDQLRREAPPRELLVRAERARDMFQADALQADAFQAANADGFVHGDLWQGNTMWSGDTLTALIDWEGAGVGPAGVDLGSLRLDAAMCFGPAAADDVLAGWEAGAGRRADYVAYWDVVAALSTPPDVGWFAGTISAQGRPDLTRELLERRRDAFLAAALDQL